MSRRYHDREPVYVEVPDVAGGYGFQTNLTQADQGSLGQVALASAAIPIFFGASRPKPPRARNLTSGVSSFVDQNVVNQLPAGWKLAARGKTYARIGDSTKTTLVYVPIAGAKYMWRIPTETLQKVGGDAQGLGIQLATNADKGFIGVNSVRSAQDFLSGKPPRVRKEAAGEGGIDVISTFASPGSLDNLPAGWNPVD